MKKSILLLLMILTITSGKSQEEINFKVGYLPNHHYTLTQHQTSENIMTYIASDDILKAMEENGVENPNISKESVLLKSISKTGGQNGNEFPLDIEVIESNNPALVIGTQFFGRFVNNFIKIDSISSSSMTEEMKGLVLEMTETMMNQIIFPNTQIKVGESFEEKTPIKMPFADIIIDMDINSIYTLKKVENGTGYFDIDQDYKLTSTIEEYTMELKGTGEGQIEYDIEKQFFTMFQLEMEMGLTIELEDFSIELQTKGTSDQTTEITKAES